MKNLLIILLLLNSALFFPVSSFADEPQSIGKNIIENGNFDTDASGWSHYFDYSWDPNNPLAAKASLAVVEKEGYDGKAYKVAITNAGSQNYSVQISYPMPLDSGVTYQMKFRASAEAPRNVAINLQQSIAPKTNWYTSEDFALTETPTDYGPFYFTSKVTDPSNSFKFYLGGGGAANGISAYFDNVEVAEVIDVTGATVPDAPKMGKVSPGNLYALVEFEVPSNTGGLTIRNYCVTSSPGGIVAKGTTSPIKVPGLTNGTSYSFTVTAVNAMGSSAPSTPSEEVIPLFKPTIYYLSSTTGNDKNDGKSPQSPLKTPQIASDFTLPGDTVLFMDDTFSFTDQVALYIKRSGSADAWITYKAPKGAKPTIKMSGHVWESVMIDANYIVFEGIEMEGDAQNLKLADAEAAENEAESGGKDWNKYAQFNNGGITLGGNNSTGCHHIVIRNCTIHDFPAGGIGSIKADYLTIENNTVYNNSWYTMYATSGISLWHLWNSDKATSYKNVVRGNLCYNNKTLVKWVSLKRYSDGNGIIIDDNKNEQDGAIKGIYTGRTLVENNICYNNGGSGIHAYNCVNVDIINNTAFNNGIVPQVAYPEIYQGSCDNGVVMNNIMYARKGGKVNANYSNKNVVYNYNIYFNGGAEIKGKYDRIADPMFVNASVDPSIADFHLSENSPAIDFGTSVFTAPAKAPAIDFEGIARPRGKAVDAGAYESAFTATGSNDLKIKNYAVSLYPNPARETITIEQSDSENFTKFRLFDPQGNLLIEKNMDNEKQNIDISSLKSGFYIVQTGSVTECSTIKLIKEK
jgi:parallel beta-helix repeat protein